MAAAEPHCPRCKMDYVLEWSNATRRDYARKHLGVCLPCMMAELERLGADESRYTFPRAA